jgi:hypothetical protein
VRREYGVRSWVPPSSLLNDCLSTLASEGNLSLPDHTDTLSPSHAAVDALH